MGTGLFDAPSPSASRNDRPRDDGMPSAMQALGMLPSLVELAAASGEWESLRRACIERGDEITFAATLAAEQRQQATG